MNNWPELHDHLEHVLLCSHQYASILSLFARPQGSFSILYLIINHLNSCHFFWRHNTLIFWYFGDWRNVSWSRYKNTVRNYSTWPFYFHLNSLSAHIDNEVFSHSLSWPGNISPNIVVLFSVWKILWSELYVGYLHSPGEVLKRWGVKMSLSYPCAFSFLIKKGNVSWWFPVGWLSLTLSFPELSDSLM